MNFMSYYLVDVTGEVRPKHKYIYTSWLLDKDSYHVD